MVKSTIKSIKAFIGEINKYETHPDQLVNGNNVENLLLGNLGALLLTNAFETP